MKCTVIRIIKYEGDEAAVRKAIQLSKPLGITDCGKGDGGQWTMTIAEHFSDLPELINIPDEAVAQSLGRIQISTPASRERESEAKIETHAMEIYNTWKHREGWVPWVVGGNSTMQSRARQLARQDLQVSKGSFEQ